MKEIVTLSFLFCSYALLCMNENKDYLQKVTHNLGDTTHLTLRLINPQEKDAPQDEIDDIPNVSDFRKKKYHSISFTHKKERNTNKLPKPNFNQRPVPQFEDNPSKNNTPENSPHKKTPDKKRSYPSSPPHLSRKHPRKDSRKDNDDNK